MSPRPCHRCGYPAHALSATATPSHALVCDACYVDIDRRGMRPLNAETVTVWRTRRVGWRTVTAPQTVIRSTVPSTTNTHHTHSTGVQS